jgi:hypothetical protein
MKTKTKAATTDRRSVSHALREAILADGRTSYRLGQEAEVDEGMIRRFLDGERAPSMATIDRLALALGLRLVETGKGRGRPAKTRRVDMVPAPEPQPLHPEELLEETVEQPPEPAPIVEAGPSEDLSKPVIAEEAGPPAPVAVGPAPMPSFLDRLRSGASTPGHS